MSDNYKKETYNTLQAMGYSYAVVDRAYKESKDQTTDGVLNYIFSNSHLTSEASYDSYDSRPNTGYSNRDAPKRQGSTSEDLELKAQLLLMGYEEYLIDASLQSG
jgi:hypothetical protein